MHRTLKYLILLCLCGPLSRALMVVTTMPIAYGTLSLASMGPAAFAATSAHGGAIPQAAQTPVSTPERNEDETYRIRRIARLVVLDVVVTDAKNNIVTQLKRSDFHVTEAKEPQTIESFEHTNSHALPPQDVTIGSTADLDRLAPQAPVNIIILDEFNTRFEDMSFARYSLQKYLEERPDKLTVPTMLVAVTLQKFTVLRDYTQKKEEILSALDHHFMAYPWQLHQLDWIGERYGAAFLTLRRVAEATMGHPGHKNMIWIGRGFPPFNNFRAPVDAEARINTEVQNCLDILRDARVTLYTIDPAGVQVQNTYGLGAELSEPFGGNYQFSRLARATGGRTLYGRNDVDAEISTAARDGSNFYTLTYRPTNNSTDSAKFRKIQVTVDRPGVTVSTRQGYYLQGVPGSVDPKAPSRILVSDVLSADKSNMVYDAVPLDLEVTPNDPERILITVDARELSWTNATDKEPRQTEVILLVSTFDRKGKEIKRDARTIKASAPTDVAPTGRLERSVVLGYRIAHDPKAVRARLVVRVSSTGRIGTLDYDLLQGATSAAPKAN